MVKIVSTTAITPVGIGRVDYSVNIERMVEGVIRSWQQIWKYYEEFLVPAGGSITRDIVINSANVVLIYDLNLVAFANTLIELELQEQSPTGVWTTIYVQLGYQKIINHITKGFPFFRNYRAIVTNHGISPVLLILSNIGMETSKQEYYLMVSPGLPLP